MADCPQCLKDFDECQCSTRLLPSQEPALEPSSNAPGADEDELTTSTRIRGYKQIKLLGRGASTSVFLAEQLTLAKRVAIKRLYHTLASDQRAIGRFELEARALSNLKHPNLAEVFDLGIADDGTPYIVMEYADGADLKSLIAQKGMLEPERAIQLACQLCDALIYAHDNQIVHRDLKPENIILVRDWQGKEVVKLVDFGIAKPTTQGGEIQRLTQTGELIGSPSYMSPEQIRGDEIDQRTDIYSLGCIMYEALSGRTPFRGESIMATLSMHLEQPSESLEKVKPHLAAWSGLSALVAKCLEKNLESRTASARELKDALEKLTAPRQNRKNDHLGIIALLFVIVAIIAAAVFISEKQSMTDGPTRQSTGSEQTTKPDATKTSTNSGTHADSMTPITVPPQNEKTASNLGYELARSEAVYYSASLC